MKHGTRLPFVATVLVLGAITATACSSDDEPTGIDAIATTDLPTGDGPETTESTTTTTEAQTTTEAPTPQAATTTVPVSRNVGLVWASQVDPARVNQPPGAQPTYTDKGITNRLEQVIYVDPTETGDLSADCQREIESVASYYKTPPESHCLFVQWSFDVAADVGEESMLSAGPLLTPGGKQIDQALAETGLPGSTNRLLSVFYAGGEPGSTLHWMTGNNTMGYTDYEYAVPGLDALPPITFS